MPHLAVTLLLAALLSATLACTGDLGARQRLYHAVYLFTTSVGLVVAGSWMMFFVER
jgi:hypothetical protein